MLALRDTNNLRKGPTNFGHACSWLELCCKHMQLRSYHFLPFILWKHKRPLGPHDSERTVPSRRPNTYLVCAYPVFEGIGSLYGVDHSTPKVPTRFCPRTRTRVSQIYSHNQWTQKERKRSDIRGREPSCYSDQQLEGVPEMLICASVSFCKATSLSCHPCRCS